MTAIERADRIRQGLEATYFGVTLTLHGQPYAVVLIEHTPYTINKPVRETDEYKAVADIIEKVTADGTATTLILTTTLRDYGYVVLSTSSAPILPKAPKVKGNPCADLLEEIQKESRPDVPMRFMTAKPQGEPMKKLLEAAEGVEPVMKPYTRRWLSDSSTGRSIGRDQEMKLPLSNLTVKVWAPNAEVSVVDESGSPVLFREIPRSALREIVEFANSPVHYKARREFQNEISQEVKAAAFFSKEDIEKCVRTTEFAADWIGKKDKPKTSQEMQNTTFARKYGTPPPISDKCNLLDSVMRGADAIDSAFIAAAGAVAAGEMQVPTPMSKYADALDKVFGPDAASLTTTPVMQSQVVFDVPIVNDTKSIRDADDDEDCAPTVAIDTK